MEGVLIDQPYHGMVGENMVYAIEISFLVSGPDAVTLLDFYCDIVAEKKYANETRRKEKEK